MTDLATIPHRDELIRARVRYDPEAGRFYWRRDVLGGQGAVMRRAGDEAGFFDIHGYRIIRIDRKQYRAARLAWLLTTGEWPQNLVDHINGVKDDDRWVNLRGGDKSLNSLNIHQPNRGSTTGLRGIKRAGNRFTAHIEIGGRRNYLGIFKSAEEAHAAYLKAKRAHMATLA